MSSGTPTASLPGDNRTGDFFTPRNNRALRFAPAPSSRVSAVQWNTTTPQSRAAAARRAQLATSPTSSAALASAGSAECSPTTPFCTSCSTSAVCAGSTSSVRSSAIASLQQIVDEARSHRVEYLQRVAQVRVDRSVVGVDRVEPRLEVLAPHLQQRAERFDVG